MGGIRLRPNLILGAISILVTVFGTTNAAHCTTWSTSEPELTSTFPWTFYVDNDPCQPDCLFSIWYYEESNGIPGLQRGDEVVNDTCHGMIESDSIICMLLPVGILTRRQRNEGGRAAGGAMLAGAAIIGATAFLPTVDAC